jgi:hypothetical protein
MSNDPTPMAMDLDGNSVGTGGAEKAIGDEDYDDYEDEIAAMLAVSVSLGPVLPIFRSRAAICALRKTLVSKQSYSKVCEANNGIGRGRGGT